MRPIVLPLPEPRKRHGSARVRLRRYAMFVKWSLRLVAVSLFAWELYLNARIGGSSRATVAAICATVAECFSII